MSLVQFLSKFRIIKINCVAYMVLLMVGVMCFRAYGEVNFHEDGRVTYSGSKAAENSEELYQNTLKILLYREDIKRTKEAEKNAKRLAQEALESSGKRYAVVSITARTPVNPPEDLWRSGPYTVSVREYDVRDGQTDNDLHHLQKMVYRREPGLWAAVEPGYFVGAAISERLPDGKIENRMMNEADNRKYVEEETSRALEVERAYRANLEKKLKADENQQQQIEREKKIKESKDREVAIEKASQERDRLYLARDRSCNSSKVSVDCVLADSKVTEWHESAEKQLNTAMCVQDAEVGPCANGRICMHCNAVEQMRKNIRLSNFYDLQINNHNRVFSSGKKTNSNFERSGRSEIFAPVKNKGFR